MLRAALVLAVVLAAPRALVQTPCSAEGASGLDFWIGTWDLTWPGGQGGTPEGETGRGTNEVTKELGGCVIHERFAAASGFEGESVSVHTPQGWRQTWVDNTGGYLLFAEGPGEDGALELRMAPFTNPQGQEQVSRMTWRAVGVDSLSRSSGALDWHWQRSTDGGATWTDVWTIRYIRRPR